MYCSKCGKEIKDSDLFCPACGTKVGSAEQRVEEPRENRTIAFQFSELEVKWLIFKLIYIALIYFVWRQSQKGMFVIGDYYWLSIDGLMDQVFSFKQYAGESVLIAKLCYWCFKIAIYGYVAAAVLALIQKEEMAKTLSGIGFMLHLPIILYSFSGIRCILEKWGISMVRFSEVFDALDEEFWIYVVLNMVIVICSSYFFNNVNLARNYSGKSYSILNESMIEPKKMKVGDWSCVECGKTNASYVHTCSCGCSKDGKSTENKK